MSMHNINVDSFENWRCQAKTLLSNDVHPSRVNWQIDSQNTLFDEPQKSPLPAKEHQISVPSQFISMAKQAACFVDPKRPSRKWAVLYSLLWRIANEHRNVLSLKTDSEVSELGRMVKAISRDMHKMKAFVRFQNDAQGLFEEQDISQDEPELYTAWFEPDHAIIEAVAPFFVKRFTGMNWSILSPQGCAHWNQTSLKFSPPVARPEISQDHYETFWKTYYCAIFNPARLKEKAMQSEMPKKYWKYLPEASCIRDLSNSSANSVQSMMSKQTTTPDRLSSKSSKLRAQQTVLRAKVRD